ncbi:hypothetical protein ACFLU5_04450 [Bacteroidota bacterium]
MKMIKILKLIFLLIALPGCQFIIDKNDKYGEELSILGDLNIGRCIDAAVDISDLNSPVKKWQLDLHGTPGLVVQEEDMVLIPAGHDGLQVYNVEDGRPYYGE